MRFMTTDLGDRFRETLAEIQSGQFARQFQAEREAGYPTLTMAQAMSTDDTPIAQAEARLRALLGGRKA
jgi:ketol-acid reductoisomerase